MNESRYSPGEQVEAQEKARERREALKEAEFYRQILDEVKEEIVSRLLRKDLNRSLGEVDVNNTTLKLKEFEHCSADELIEVVREKALKAGERLGRKGAVSFDPQKLADMTPVEFVQYIDKTKESLVKP